MDMKCRSLKDGLALDSLAGEGLGRLSLFQAEAKFQRWESVMLWKYMRSHKYSISILAFCFTRNISNDCQKCVEKDAEESVLGLMSNVYQAPWMEASSSNRLMYCLKLVIFSL